MNVKGVYLVIINRLFLRDFLLNLFWIDDVYLKLICVYYVYDSCRF